MMKNGLHVCADRFLVLFNGMHKRECPQLCKMCMNFEKKTLKMTDYAQKRQVVKKMCRPCEIYVYCCL